MRADTNEVPNIVVFIERGSVTEITSTNYEITTETVDFDVENWRDWGEEFEEMNEDDIRQYFENREASIKVNPAADQEDERN